MATDHLKSYQWKKGQSGNPNGRPARADEQFLVDLWEEDGKKVFTEAVKEGHQWAIRKLIDKLFSNRRDIPAKNEERKLPIPIMGLKLSDMTGDDLERYEFTDEEREVLGKRLFKTKV